ncbi:MAG: ABC transporter ATP-binding protein [Lachnospiraceae bacterium]|nr:ABC transporter ATP-binding protein [Lachnospiraceae bacterium]
MVLEVKNLEIEFFDHDQPETVVHDLSMHLKAGEILGIVGESGSGKSMTAMAIAGLLHRADLEKRGKILYGDTDLLTCPRTRLRQIQGREIGVVFQEPMTSLNPLLKIGRQVEETLRLHTDMTSAQRRQRVLEMLSDVELRDPEELLDKYPHELSGGMRQRVMIAAAMIMNPKILIADEPTTALDVTVEEQIIELLRRLSKRHKTSILFISHDLSLVRKLCERVIVMQNGYAVEQGTTEQIFEHPKMEYTQKLMDAVPKMRF